MGSHTDQQQRCSYIGNARRQTGKYQRERIGKETGEEGVRRTPASEGQVESAMSENAVERSGPPMDAELSRVRG